METYIRLADSVIEFDIEFLGTPTSEHTKHSLKIQQEELKVMWEKAKALFDDLLATESIGAKDLSSIRKKGKTCYAAFVRCMSKINDLSEKFEKSEKEDEDMSATQHNLHLPPCDIDAFKGDYLSWPTFRDMFTAIYILNKRLTPIQKLYYLSQKTQGEAKEIVKKCDLTNDGFNIAWKNLCDS
ncbi:uncharacterized protein LOC118755451 [Rhagoletis pomonella]|uniref:uncharacterized protein LOC118733919 n=2 Tax=Rhagoletis pomonella TaxID=28610 RepID=UPI00177FB4F1|nr:uncharacterized protein LOC118733919 [Rhagoletis pomonella]XP_036345342.1 uncharacterized protein LOC118754562 [Rhagoletis pomonella]XP_036346176.1 uncharacterized protein LOC118755451 [Rhagoletis pomonella]